MLFSVDERRKKMARNVGRQTYKYSESDLLSYYPQGTCGTKQHRFGVK
jgi:hypothetical protein